MSHHIEGIKFYSFTPMKMTSHRVYVVESLPSTPNTRVIPILSRIAKYFRYPLETNLRLKIRSKYASKLNSDKISYLVYLLSETVLPLYLSKYDPHSQALVTFIEFSKDDDHTIYSAALITKKDIKNIGKKPTLFVAIVRNGNKQIDITQINSIFKMTWLYLAQILRINKVVETPSPPLKTYAILVTLEDKVEDKFIEISVPEFHESIKIKIPIRSPIWFLEDLPPKLRDDIVTIIINPLASNTTYAPHGILITGPPGVGKSVTAEVVASALELKIIELRPSLYRSMWYGLTEKVLEGILKNIKSRKNSLVLLDDADFLVGRHVSLHETHISEITILLRYLQESSRPLTILTTNAPELLDHAIVRPGRIDVVIVMGYPDREFRKQIALKSVKRYNIDLPQSLLDYIANITRWFSNAEIDALIRLAASRGNGKITDESLVWARQRFNINEQMRISIQNQLRWFGEHFQGIVIKYVANENEII